MKILNVLAGLVLLALPLNAQVVDSVTINILALPSAIDFQAPESAYIGDTISIAYTVLGDDGLPTDGIVTWTTRPANLAEIVTQTDSTVSLVILRRDAAREDLTLIASVSRLDRLVIGGRYETPGIDENGNEIQPGTFVWEGPYSLQPGGSIQMCAAGFSGERLIFVSDILCYDNIEALIGSVPPLNGVYRADANSVMPLVFLNPKLGVATVTAQ